ncbi:MAG: tetratricopeptide repeat protein [Candidatus Zixiibacteriota bacterium]|nr:MAG: tetratricopeptide repeat protein [candidate division Zixibacteria bacterium]
MFRSRLTGSHLFYLLSVLVIVGGSLLWTSNLFADPPVFFSGMGQSLSTDPAHCVYHARNSVLFDDPDPFDFERWVVLERSLTSFVARLWFSVAGVSLTQANMVGVLLSAAALIFLLLAVSRHHRPWVTFTVALCYLVNTALILHGRLSYLENGLLLIMSLLFFVYSWWGDRWWGRCLSGFLVAAAMLLGKMFGLLLLPALLLADWSAGDRKRVVRVSVILGSFALSLIVLFFAVYRSAAASAYRFYTEGSYGLHGFPEGLSSPWSFVEHVVSYGFENRLFFLSLDSLIFILLGGFLLTYLLAGGHSISRLPRLTLLSAFAVGLTIVGVSPLNYSPTRYGLLLISPAIILCFGLFDYVLSAERPAARKTGFGRYVLLGILIWLGLFHTAGLLFFMNDAPVRLLTWVTLPAAVGITMLIRRAMNNGGIVLTPRLLHAGIAVIIAFSLVINAYHISTRMLPADDTTIADASADLAGILGPNAVVAGPYGPLFTLNNNHKSFIYYFAVAKVDPTLLLRYPITHLAVDSSNFAEAARNYPAVKDMETLTLYWIGDYAVKICNIAELTGNAEAGGYRRTAYERAMSSYLAGKRDSAMAEINRFLQQQPNSRSANLLLAQLLIDSGQYQRARTILTGLTGQHPGDYYANVVCGQVYQIMALRQRDNNLQRVAQDYYARAAGNSRFKAEHARYVYQATERQYQAAGGSTGGKP